MWWLTFKYLSALSPSGLQELPLPTLSLSTLHSLTLASTIRKRQGLFIRLPHPRNISQECNRYSTVDPSIPPSDRRRSQHHVYLVSRTETWDPGTCPSLWLWTMNRIVHHFVGSARRSAATTYLSTTSKITSAARTFHQPNTIVSSRQ